MTFLSSTHNTFRHAAAETSRDSSYSVNWGLVFALGANAAIWVVAVALLT